MVLNVPMICSNKEECSQVLDFILNKIIEIIEKLNETYPETKYSTEQPIIVVTVQTFNNTNAFLDEDNDIKQIIEKREWKWSFIRQHREKAKNTNELNGKV